MDTSHLRILRPAPGVLGFYDGRVEGQRFAPEPNWVDDGAISLGVASFAVVEGERALLHDTHVSVAHGRRIREALKTEGVREIAVLLSHWHLDHVAGTEAFADCEVIASARTEAHLQARREGIEAGTLEGPPAIAPLIMPTRTFEGRMDFELGSRRLEFIEANIHSDDAAVVWDPAARLLLAGDTVEDTVTYVDEPRSFPQHLRDLEGLLALDPRQVLPSHGDPDVIAAGGYGAGLLRATQDYIRFLRRCREEPSLRDLPLQEVLASSIEAGWVRYYEPYEAVHRSNLAAISAFPSCR
jgi:cyclase